MTVSDLPLVNSCLNGAAALLLTLGFLLIQMGHRKAHGAVMSLALLVSAVFLGCYLTYHYYVGHVRFAGVGGAKTFYYTLLISHVLLAIINLPLVFLTAIPAIRSRFQIHKRWAKITLPIWMYVSVTGVIVYLMCHVWYGPPLSAH
jgi:putative membrane protein